MATTPEDDHRSRGAPQRRRSLLAAGMVGVGLMAAVDEIVFHQVLGWHHLFDRSTSAAALVSDGILHAMELVLLLAGFFLLAGLRHRNTLLAPTARAGVFLGLGAFQLFDGVVDHKVLRLHQIRYSVDLLPYDLVWDLTGAVLLLIGVVLAVRSRAPRHGTPGEHLGG
jgi:uncharacterized membrane protein